MGVVRTGILGALVVYVADVWVRPARVAARARAAADARGKPLLNIGAGTPGSSLRAALLGPTLWGDVNLDIAARGACATPAWVEAVGAPRVCRADGMALPYADKEFGACISSHCLEHLENPVVALAEWNRVADEVFLVVPWWWTPHAWLHPGHRWIFTGSPETGLRGHRLR